jgi:hypothetical protein
MFPARTGIIRNRKPFMAASVALTPTRFPLSDTSLQRAKGPAPGIEIERTIDPLTNTENMVLNMGPQHPSTHGVLRLVLELDGETGH